MGAAMANGQGNRVDPDGPYEGVPGGGRFSVQGSRHAATSVPAAALGRVGRRQREHGRNRVEGAARRNGQPARGKRNTGRPGNGGTIATAGGLVFVGATDDARFRAFDAKTGKELWTVKLGGAAEATPMTYEGRDGRQYVVITSTGGGFFGNPVTDDSIMAFALDGSE